MVVDNSPWLHELKLREGEFTTRVRERFPEVRALRLALGHLAHDAAEARQETPKPVPLSAADRTEIETAVAAIPDADVAETARRLMTTARRYPRTRQAATVTRRGARGAV